MSQLFAFVAPNDVPTSTGDDVIQKHVCIADRAKMLKGEPATERGFSRARRLRAMMIRRPA